MSNYFKQRHFVLTALITLSALLCLVAYKVEIISLSRDAVVILILLLGVLVINQLLEIVKSRELEQQIEKSLQQQQKAEQSEVFYRNLVDNIIDIVTIVNNRGEISYASPSAERVLGLSVEQYISHDIRELVNLDDVLQIDFKTLYTQYVDNNKMVHRVRSASGEYHIMESSICPFDNGDGEEYYLLSSRDITVRAKAEAENRKLQRVIEQLPNSVIITDTDGSIEYVNPAFEKSTGYSATEAIGLNPRVLKSETTPSCVFVDLWKTIKTGNVWQGEFVNKKKNGELYEESVQIIPITNYRGEIGQYVAIKENITELKHAQHQAESANRAKSMFLSRMSHELRTPLHAINGFSSLMLKSKKNPLNDKQKEMAEQILAGGNHLLQLINEVLDLAIIESGKLPLSLEPLDPGSIIDDCLALIQPLAKNQNIIIRNCAPEILPQIRADLTRTKQALLNFLSNAVKYNRPGGLVTLQVKEETAGTLLFRVTDTGLGIVAEKQKEIFTPFARVVENPDTIEGTGIGLTITKQLVEAMGGAIGFESQYGSGSCFWFTLPIIADG